MFIRFDLFDDSAELRKALESADWVLSFEVWEEKNYTVEIDGEEFYKVEYPDGSIVITDDPATALGEVGE